MAGRLFPRCRKRGSRINAKHPPAHTGGCCFIRTILSRLAFAVFLLLISQILSKPGSAFSSALRASSRRKRASRVLTHAGAHLRQNARRLRPIRKGGRRLSRTEAVLVRRNGRPDHPRRSRVNRGNELSGAAKRFPDYGATKQGAGSSGQRSKSSSTAARYSLSVADFLMRLKDFSGSKKE